MSERVTYESGHDDTNLFYRSLELVQIDAALVLHVEVLELLVEEGGLVNVLRVLLLNLLL